MHDQPTESTLGLDFPGGWWPAAEELESLGGAGFSLIQVFPFPLRALGCAPVQPPRRGASPPAGGRRARPRPARAAGPARGHVRQTGPWRGCSPTAPRSGPRTPSTTPTPSPTTPRARTASWPRPAPWPGSRPAPSGSGVTIALENLAPTYPREELLSDKPLVLRALAHRIGSPRVGLCLDVGHAHVVAELKHTALDHLVFPALDTAVLFHLHDNLGARWNGSAPPELDPVRLDLHLAPGEGTVPWESIAPALASHGAPLMLEVPPFRRPEPAELHAAARRLLAPAPLRAA